MEFYNQAAYMIRVKKLELTDIPMPKAGAGEIVVKMEYVGVCGSDVHFFESGARKGVPFKLPFVLGHECAGSVIEVGEDVSGLTPGDRVTFEPQQTCGKCYYCREGRYNLCPDVVFPSVPPYDGMLRRFGTMPAHLAFKLPDNVSSLEGAMIEPLAVGLAAAARGNVSLGKTVAILGSGCIGLTTILACKAMVASRIIVADLYSKRLEKASELGATDTIITIKEDTEKTVERILELTRGEGAELVIETAGNQATAALTGRVLRRGGVIVMVGNVNGQTPFDFLDLMYKEGEIRTIYRYHNNFPMAIEAVSTGQINIKGIAPQIYSFEEVQNAFEHALNDRENLVKAMVQF
jgi:L-iditol 2-dehydrogenase